MNHVVCVKWGNKYIPKYVNILYNMVKRHTTVPFQFHCLTDDPAGIDINNINIIKLPTDPWIKTWWSKLWMFAPEMPIKGNILYFDLDVVIFDNIDELFTFPGKLNIIRDFNRCRVPNWKLSNSSCMKWESGTMDYLWTKFLENPSLVMQNNHGDQDWITKRATNDIAHWPDDWIRSYKWEMVGLKDTKLLTKDGKSFFRTPATINKGNKVAVFHGRPNPMECADVFVTDNWK